MIVSALVVTLSPEPCLRAAALQSLGECPALELGEPSGERLPVVAEVETAAAGALLCEQLAERPGVLRVDVVAIDFGEEEAALAQRLGVAPDERGLPSEVVS